MKLARIAVAALIALMPAAAFATPGAWNASKRGVVLEHRGVTVSSPAFLPSPTLAVGGDNHVTLVYWRYESSSPTPLGLVVQLCTLRRCVKLNDASGQTRSFSGVPANSEFRFIYYIEGGGRLHRAFNVNSISLAVNYK